VFNRSVSLTPAEEVRGMIGDKLVITEYGRRNGRKVVEEVLKRVSGIRRVFVVTVAGESGSGKSETAFTTAQELGKVGLKAIILAQDDYFRLPPRTNSKKRREDIDWVGPGEVRLDLMDEHLQAARQGVKEIIKPLVYFNEDRIGDERLLLDGIEAVIAEGTYTTILKEADIRVFIDADYRSTLNHRKKRARDEAEGDFIENVLDIEHRIISSHKSLADVVLLPQTQDSAGS
jgi:uridine kinase